jgi:hypothetical protein
MKTLTLPFAKTKTFTQGATAFYLDVFAKTFVKVSYYRYNYSVKRKVNFAKTFAKKLKRQLSSQTYYEVIAMVSHEVGCGTKFRI